MKRGEPRGGKSRRGEQQAERPKRGLGADEQKYFGRNACQAIFDTRPEEIVRVYLTERTAKPFAALTHYCAKERKAFHIVTPEDIEKFTGSEHHQGVALIAKKRSVRPLKSLSGEDLTGCFLYLDGIENPHNFGAILRSCGFFTISGVIGRKGELPSYSGTVCRTAEGAAEMVSVYQIDGIEELAAAKKGGYRVIATSSHAKRSLYQTVMPENTIIILGSEGHGMSPDIAALADETIAIPGAGAVESLNVSAACAVLLGEYVRQRTEEKRLRVAKKNEDRERKRDREASRNGHHVHAKPRPKR